MKDPKILYILIIIFCIFAIIAGIYAQFIAQKNDETNNLNVEETIMMEEGEKSQVELKEQLNELFTNTLNLNGYDTTGIQKLNTEEDIVYTAYDIQETNDVYEVNMKIPAVNIKNELSITLNNATQTTFINKANEIIANKESKKKTIYTIDYAAYVNNDILSLVIRSTLKEGTAAQRVMIQTYNYNLTNNTEASLVDLITVKKLNKDEVNDKIAKVVKIAYNESQALKNMGYNQIYNRDLTNEMYTVDGAGVYFLGPNGELYIIYPYGNNEFTSTMDIILFE